MRTMASMYVPDEGSSRGGSHQCRLRTGTIAGILSGQAPDSGPVKLVATLREEPQKSIAQQTCKRHRHAEALRRGQREADVLVSERCGETGRLKLSLSDQGAVSLI